jgi:hypothetical protein
MSGETGEVCHINNSRPRAEVHGHRNQRLQNRVVEANPPAYKGRPRVVAVGLLQAAVPSPVSGGAANLAPTAAHQQQQQRSDHQAAENHLRNQHHSAAEAPAIRKNSISQQRPEQEPGTNSANSGRSNGISNSGSRHHVVNFSIEKRKRIELTSLDTTQPGLLTTTTAEAESQMKSSPINNNNNTKLSFIESPRKGGQNSYQDYFDNLISLIDEAARELSV